MIDQAVVNSGGLDGVCTLLIPGWQAEPIVEDREDGVDEITLIVTKAHPYEAWRLVRLRRGVLCAMAYLTRRASGGRITRSVYEARVLVPPARRQQIRILTHREG